LGLGLAAALFLGIATGPAGATSAPTQVICVSGSSVERVQGAYTVRPHACNFHERGRPAADAFMVQMTGIHWRHWGAREANGVGFTAANMIGLVRTRVRLSAPAEVCGHRIFTIAHFRFRRLPASGSGIQLDRRLPASCRAAPRLQLPYRECRDVGPQRSDSRLFDVVTRKVACERARGILRRWYHDPSAKDSGPKGWRCAQIRRGRYALRSYCHRNGRLIAFSQYLARR
jgi:hypothetical protein